MSSFKLFLEVICTETLTKIVLSLWIVTVLFPIVCNFAIMFPADAAYNRIFKAHVVMAYDQASFEGIKEQILILWRNMNETFGTEDLEHIYNTPWYWEQTYDNSLKAQTDYFKKLVDRIDKQIYEANQILSGNRTILMPYNQWYQQALDALRQEMQREGGLDWAIWGAWYLKYAPLAYWMHILYIPIEIALVSLTMFLSIIWAAMRD